MRKTLFQGILGASIAVCAVSLGIMLTRYLSLRSYSPKPPRASAAAPARPAATPSPESWKNIFAPTAGMQLPSRLPASGPDGTAVRSNFVLLGTIVSTRPGDSRAILWSDGMKLPKLVRVDEQVEPGAVLASVTRDGAVIARGPGREQLELLPVGSKARSSSAGGGQPAEGTATGKRAAARQAPADNASAGSPDASLRVERLGENRFALDEAGLAQLSGNINQFMTNVRIVPYFEGSSSAGYRIAAIRPGSAFDKLGFRGGDVLQQVNGVALSSPEKVYTIFQNLKDEKKVSVNIVRQGQKSTLNYEIR